VQAHTELDAHERERCRDWQAREAAVVEAEARAAAELAAAHQHAAELHAQADREAQLIRGHAHNRAQQITAAAEQAAAQKVAQAGAEVERLQRLRESTRAEIQRLLRTLDGIRDALAYDLESATPQIPSQQSAPPQSAAATAATRRSGGPATVSGAAAEVDPGAALGQRRGDLHRARLSGLVAAAPTRHPDPADSDAPGERPAVRGSEPTRPSDPPPHRPPPW
jgi:hypothetical protein